MNADLETFCNEWLGALMSGGAQGLVVALAVWLLLKACRRANAATRHAVWFAALLLIALLPALLMLAPMRTEITQRLRSLAHDSVPVALVGGPTLERSPTTMIVTEPATLVSIDDTPQVEIERSLAEAPYAPARLEVVAQGAVSVGVVAGLSLLAFARLIVLARQLLLLRRLKREGVRADPLLHGIFKNAAALMNCGRQPQLLISEETAAPMVVGYLRPAVLLPSSVMESATRAQLEQIFRHELAHIARNDDWANLVQQVIAAVFFFHPAVWIASRRLTTEREIACDDHALAGLPSPRDYALLLTEFASRMKGRDYPAAPAAWNRNSQLKERIAMILDKKRNASPRVSRAGVGAMTLATLGLALAALIAFPRITLAGPAAEPTPRETAVDAADLSVKTTVDVDVSADANATPRVQIHRRELRANGVNGDVLLTPPLEKPESDHPPTPPVPPTPPEPSALATPAPAPLAQPTPKIKVHPGKAMIVAPDGRTLELKPQPRPGKGPEDAGLEKRLERVERMLEKLVASTKRVDMSLTLAPDLQEKMKADIAHAQKDANQLLKDLDVPGMKKRAQEAALMHQTLAGKELALSLDSFKARQKELEQRRRALDREAAALDREMEQLKHSQERLSDQKERDEEREQRRVEKAQRDQQKAIEKEIDIKRRDTGEKR